MIGNTTFTDTRCYLHHLVPPESNILLSSDGNTRQSLLPCDHILHLLRRIDSYILSLGDSDLRDSEAKRTI